MRNSVEETMSKTIQSVNEKVLHELGVFRFGQIAADAHLDGKTGI